MIDPQRLRELADTLDCYEWDNARHYAAVSRHAADELERLRLGVRVALCRVFRREVTDEFVADWLDLMAAKAAKGDSGGRD